MKRIQRLSTQLANQIAAGEVVERPSSVVKELLENSLDAGADRIDIDLIDAGTRLIQVTDNGSGIHPDDLPLALSPHATSKIQTTADLEAIATMGFRGEALASIAAISRFELASRLHRAEQGFRAFAEGKDMQAMIEPCGCAVGTRVSVKDLFFNTPVRRRFLCSDKTELNHIEDTIKRFCLSAFHINIQLNHNGKALRRYRAVTSPALEERRLKDIFGAQFLRDSFHLQCEVGDLSLKGWVGGQNCHRSSSDGQYFFVNGRVVKDKVLSHAIRQAYESLLPVGRFPCYALYLQLPQTQVDVNVHPTKHEVRFKAARDVHDFVVQSVRNHLLQRPEGPTQKTKVDVEIMSPEPWQRRARTLRSSLTKLPSQQNKLSQARPTEQALFVKEANPKQVISEENRGLVHLAGAFFGYRKNDGFCIFDGLQNLSETIYRQWCEEQAARSLRIQAFLRPILLSEVPETKLLNKHDELVSWGLTLRQSKEKLLLMAAPRFFQAWTLPFEHLFANLDASPLASQIQIFVETSLRRVFLGEQTQFAQLVAEKLASFDLENEERAKRLSEAKLAELFDEL